MGRQRLHLPDRSSRQRTIKMREQVHARLARLPPYVRNQGRIHVQHHQPGLPGKMPLQHERQLRRSAKVQEAARGR